MKAARRGRGGARGAAIVMALLIVTLATVLVSGLYWGQSVLARSVENRQASVQARWLLRGALDWARLILREDARTSATDHLGEPWAVPIESTRLDDDGGGEPAWLSGSIEDAQSRFNLANLVAGRQPVAREVESLQRLLANIGLSESIADTIVVRMQLAQPEPVAGATPGAAAASAPAPQGKPAVLTGLIDVDDLLGENGLEAAVVERLRPFVTVLPEPTPVNANTAPAEVLAARIDGLSLSQARTLVASRDRLTFKDREDVLKRLPQISLTASDADVSVSTRYFLVRGTVNYRRAEVRLLALVSRVQGATDVVWQREPL